jgi:L-histidine N-alpha-methyltransferase
MAVLGHQIGEMMEQFQLDVARGLSAERKFLSSKYFYDETGSRIFQEIMEMPEYYLTGAEFEILTQQALKIGAELKFRSRFNVVELGAGDGLKTLAFLSNLLAGGMDLRYVPIDVSAGAIESLQQRILQAGMDLEVAPMVGDYFECLETFKRTEPTLFLFLGANIGNYSPMQTLELLAKIKQQMLPEDRLLIGFDLQKNPITIHQAYYDPHGITKRFNLNLLARINAELEANFLLDQFDFYCHYNPENGELRSYLVSLKQQHVTIGKLGRQFVFARNELIWTELSKKYSLLDISQLAEEAGFILEQNFFDCQHHFVDSLWRRGEA